MQDTLIEVANQHWQHFLENCPQAAHYETCEKQLKPIFALSDFIAESVVQQAEIIDQISNDEASKLCHEYLSNILSQQLDGVSTEEQFHRVLRQFRRHYMVIIASADLLNKQSIETSLMQVSALADVLINHSNNWLHKQLCVRYGEPKGELGTQSLLILGMGKLGGRELNFSSDIDLIFAYPSSGETQGGKKSIEHHQFFTKLAQQLITALDKTTAQGQVFRVDMRLRPFGESGPLVSSFSALEDYYQDQGRDWERYAMIKARILNHQDPYAHDLSKILTPFVFRRYLDYGAIDSLRKMKGLISQEVRRRRLDSNIKLGEGGIREVEFIVQSFQIIRGGRESDLQQPGLLHNLKTLPTLGHLQQQNADSLRESYLFLRKVEHCLQQFADKQTQNLPTETRDQYRLLKVMGFEDYPSFLKTLEGHMSNINGEFSLLIGNDADSEETSLTSIPDEISALWKLEFSGQETVELLSAWLNEEQAQVFYQNLSQFKLNLGKKGVGQRGLDTLGVLIPQLLCIILEQQNVNYLDVLTRALTVLNSIAGRTTYLQLLHENHGVSKQLVRLCAASPWISEQIARFPILLDELLNPAELYNPTPFDQYSSELRPLLLRIEPDDLELQMEMLRQFKLSQQLKIAAADVTGVLPVMKVSDHLTFLAEAIIAEVVVLAWQQITEKHGAPLGKDAQNMGFGVIGYGKLGGIELGYGSDLDLVFVHNADVQELTIGPKPIESGRFYTKLAQRIMHLFITKTMSGLLYDVDMRLRPSGNAGVLVSQIDGYAYYLENEAWTWEHQALVRTRFIYGDRILADQFNTTRTNILCKPRDPKRLATDVSEMREKMRKHLSLSNSDTFDIKQDNGGIADIEFLVQYWVLANCNKIDSLTTWSDNIRILEQLANENIISKSTSEALGDAYLSYRNTSHRLALQQRERLENASEFKLQRDTVRAIWEETLPLI